MKETLRSDAPNYYEINLDSFYPSATNLSRFHLGTIDNFKDLIGYLRYRGNDELLEIVLSEYISKCPSQVMPCKVKKIVKNVLIDEFTLLWIKNTRFSFKGVEATIVKAKNPDGYTKKYVFFDKIGEFSLISQDGRALILPSLDCALVEAVEKTYTKATLKGYLGYSEDISNCLAKDEVSYDSIDASVYRQLVYDLGFLDYVI